MSTWIYFTILAALMQSVRTAGQKQLSGNLSAFATTLVRFLFALPFAWLYCLWLANYYDVPAIDPHNQFLQFAALASVAQIGATIALIVAFRLQNFAVATSFAKTEAVLTAIMGVLIFEAALSGYGWLSVIVGVVGVLILSQFKFTFKSLVSSPAAGFGIVAGLGFAMATLWLREASLSLNINPLVSASITLAVMVSMQTFILLVFVFLRERKQLVLMMKHWKLASFIGVTSMLGSVGWFTAASLQNAAYVKALGQIEFFFALLLTHRLFKEKVSIREYLGMSLIVVSVLVLLLLA